MEERWPLIAGNWKMHGHHREGVALAAAVAEKAASYQSTHGPLHLDLLICPPATLLREITETLAESVITVGGQDCHEMESGAHTGDVSAAMLKDAGCSYVIVGHSERRTGHGESNDQVKAKAVAARACGLTAIICIGETREQRDRGEAMAILIFNLKQQNLRDRPQRWPKNHPHRGWRRQQELRPHLPTPSIPPHFQV